uniref:Uncharacterized protein n=1 Tax=uncultured prokaryote TaxID=198431 RepID=A0A0H5Q3C8_9ZZZZ|nr:hypothetical protein [uncultured prokaryote]
MDTVHKKKRRFRCDYCKRLIGIDGEGSRVRVDGRVVEGMDDRWYDFCNKSQWDKYFSSKYQLALPILYSERPV